MCEKKYSLPGQMLSLLDIMEFFLHIAQTYSIQTIGVETKNGGLSSICFRAIGINQASREIIDAIQSINAGKRINDYSYVHDIKEGLIYLCQSSDFCFCCFDMDHKEGLTVKSLNGQRSSEKCRMHGPGFELTILNAFSFLPDVYRRLEREYVQLMRIANCLRAFALGSPEVSLTLSNNGKTIFVAPGDGALKSCLESVFLKRISKHLKTVHETIDGMECTVHFSPWATEYIEQDIAVLRLNGNDVTCPHLKEKLAQLYGNEFTTAHYLFVAEIKTEKLTFHAESFDKLLCKLDIRAYGYNQTNKTATSLARVDGFPSFIGNPRIEEGILPNVQHDLQVEKAFSRFFMIRQENYLYIVDSQEALTQLKLMEMQQEHSSDNILVSNCNIILSTDEVGLAVFHTKALQILKKIGFDILPQKDAIRIRTCPYYIKTSYVTDLFQLFQKYLAQTKTPSASELLYIMAYYAAKIENANSRSPFRDNIVLLLKTLEHIIKEAQIRREAIPIYRFKYNDYDKGPLELDNPFEKE